MDTSSLQYGVFGENTKVSPPKKSVKKIKEFEKNEVCEVYMTVEKSVKLKNQSVVCHTGFKKTVKEINDKSLDNLKPSDGVYNGFMSPATKRDVQRILENWLTAVELNTDNDYKTNKVNRESVYVTFVTLTLPSKQLHHDNTLKNECLDPFLEWVREKKGWNVKAYLWRAESQKNGNVHFHIVLDRWIDHERIRKKWNQLINRLGYIDRYRKTQKYIYQDGFVYRESQAEKQIESLMYLVEQCKKDSKLIPDTRFIDNPMIRNTLNEIILTRQSLDESVSRMLVYRIQKTAYDAGATSGWDNPNTTDVHKLGSVNSISAYVTKYVSKSDLKYPTIDSSYQKIEKVNGVEYIFEKGFDDLQNEWVKKEKVVYLFESRKVQGNIWGKSRTLTDKKLLQPPTYTTEIKAIYSYKNNRDSTLIKQNEVVSDYVSALKIEMPSKQRLKVAKLIQSEYCEVIPIGHYEDLINHKTKRKRKTFVSDSQLSTLETLSPFLKTEYLAYYQNLFMTIYNDS